MLGDRMLTRIKTLHSLGFLHRDIKPENFIIDKKNKVYMVDFGLAGRFIKKETNEHIIFKDKRKFFGTKKFASLNTILGYEQSRRDDIESLGYTLIYLLKGKLFWNSNNETRTNDVITDWKMNLPIDNLCTGLPTVMYKYLSYARGLMFDAEPDYSLLMHNFRKYLQSNFIPDWKILNIDLGVVRPELNLEESHKAKSPILLKYKDNVKVGEPFKLSEDYKKKKRKMEVEKLIESMPKNFFFVKNLSIRHSATKGIIFYHIRQ